ncbi:ATP-binding region ATPase domain-containing protein [Streptomyces albus]|uniref:ATP-binding region ATPase domain-containing protein n=1 Tax=Streptomyces albus (strain ATCC 21838 / DSM 41398 / FERM P-419 / JCM 4703 / NBRC 107858) TaxID=1081613 RepID=A0A0B5EKE4_STRA4|nr:ATP-binding region ATPase domain-containing protein [Streptomyces albus]AOU77066.1 ATP-binding region ATPase domain-containing protein [Streptomyces albus]AYN32844.1 ATP-binding protein [Streptomyces albus]
MDSVTSQLPVTVRMFHQLFPSTRLGVRRARLLADGQLAHWGLAQDTAERARQIIAELAANAVQHGRLPGRDFRLALGYAAPAPGSRSTALPGELRIEVTDARGERHPDFPSSTPTPDAESGRGLLLVATFADRWGVEAYPPSGKTVWAEVDVQPAPGDF